MKRMDALMTPVSDQKTRTGASRWFVDVPGTRLAHLMTASEISTTPGANTMIRRDPGTAPRGIVTAHRGDVASRVVDRP